LSASLLVAGVSMADVPGGAPAGGEAAGGAAEGGAAAGGAAAGGEAAGGAAAGGEAAGGGGSGETEDEGCSVANAGAPAVAGTMSALAFLGLAFAGGARRRTKK